MEIFIFSAVAIFSFMIYGMKDYTYMAEFKCMFKWNCVDLKIYYLLAGARVCFGLVLALVNSTFAAAVVIILSLTGIGVILWVRRSYSDRKHTIRSVINLGFGMIIMCCYLVMSIKGPTDGQDFYSKIPIIVVAVLFLAAAMALCFTFWQLVFHARNHI